MDIQQYIAADKELLLNLNGSQSLFWDGFMWVAYQYNCMGTCSCYAVIYHN